VTSETPNLAGGGPDFHLAGGVLTIDLTALADNWRTAARLSAPAEAAAVVKADAYGLGIEHAVPALVEAGCRRFFVALPHEGVRVRAAAPEATIYVLSGPLGPEAAAVLREHGLVPVLNSVRDTAIWEAEGWLDGQQLPAALHVDTGMNRLGMTLAEAAHFAGENALTGAVKITLLISHLACADERTHLLNARQLEVFHQARQLFPGVEASLAASSGMLLGGDFLCELTRPGIELYGGLAASPTAGFTPHPVVTAQARVLQVRKAARGEAVGYGAAMRLMRDSELAIAGAGYADGLPRAASGAGVPLRAAVSGGAIGFIRGQRVPVAGRISMDLTIFDVTGLGADAVAPGDMIELFGPNIPIDEAARAAGTIPYELLTGLSRRFHRVYVRGEVPLG
jgi:alanine racemase